MSDPFDYSDIDIPELGIERDVVNTDYADDSYVPVEVGEPCAGGGTWTDWAEPEVEPIEPTQPLEPWPTEPVSDPEPALTSMPVHDPVGLDPIDLSALVDDMSGTEPTPTSGFDHGSIPALGNSAGILNVAHGIAGDTQDWIDDIIAGGSVGGGGGLPGIGNPVGQGINTVNTAMGAVGDVFRGDFEAADRIAGQNRWMGNFLAGEEAWDDVMDAHRTPFEDIERGQAAENRHQSGMEFHNGMDQAEAALFAGRLLGF